MFQYLNNKKIQSGAKKLQKKHAKSLLVLIVSLLVLLSLFPRSVEVLNGNPIFGFDNGRDYLAVKSIIVDHKLTLIGEELGAGQAGFSYIFQGPGYFYLLAIPFFLFDGNPVGGVGLMLFLGLASIVFGIYFMTKFWSPKAGLLMGFFLATSPFLISQARFFENPFAPTLFILIAFYLTYRFTKPDEKHRERYVFLASFVTASIYHFELGVAVPIMITLFVYCIYLFRKKFFSYLPYLFAGFILAFTPMILFEFRHGFKGSENLFNYLFLPKESHAQFPPVWKHAGNIVNLFIYMFVDSYPQKLLFSANVMALGFVGLITFIFVKEKDTVRKNFLVFLLLLFPITLLVFLPLKNNVYQHYITHLTLVFIFLTTYSVVWLYKYGYQKISTLLSIFFIILFVMGGINAAHTTISDYQDYGGTHKLKGKIDAIDFIYKDAKNKPFGLFVFTPSIFTHGFDYLLWWHGKRTYGYMPYQEKKGTFYLLIEKDYGQPWTYNGWKETVIKTGRVVYTKTLPSGFIVEKRVSNGDENTN